MFELEVDANFSAAHFLRGYQGKCENLHGHNYKVRLTVAGPSLNHIGLLVDFKELKRSMGTVLERLDHCNLNDLEMFRDANPSAENIAAYLFHEFDAMLGYSTDHPAATVTRVRVWEAEGRSASYIRES
jgi:6-pyruvoyltetrahydropterin/6-carboxytetrahydropterin synthase